MKQIGQRVYARGFTLIELMVVVAIIGILMAAGIVAFSNIQKTARDAKRRADLDAIGKALEQYNQNNNQYYYVAVDTLGPNWDDATRKAALGVFFPSGSMPIDPTNDSVTSHFYTIYSLDQNHAGAVNTASRFCVFVRLELGKGNCSGSNGTTLSNATSYQCSFVTPGTGTHYCVQNRQ